MTARLLVPAAVYAAILAASSIPAGTGSGGGLAGPAWISLVVHVVEYTVLGLALRWAVGADRPWWGLVLVGVMLAAGDEAYQGLAVAGRRIQAVDLALDMVGLGLGVWVLPALEMRWFRWRGGEAAGSRRASGGSRGDPAGSPADPPAEWSARPGSWSDGSGGRSGPPGDR